MDIGNISQIPRYLTQSPYAEIIIAIALIMMALAGWKLMDALAHG